MSETKYVVSHNRHRMDLGAMTGWACGAYWGWFTPERFQRAVSNSMIFGVFAQTDGHEQQVGFARVVSDSSVNSMITDVYIAADHRGKGVGTRLMQYVVDHPSVSRTICVLNCRAENIGFYQRFAFRPLGGTVMQRDPNPVKK